MPTLKRAICFSVAGLFVASAMLAQQRFTLEMTRRVVRLSSPAVAPDGRTVAVVVTRSNFKDDRMDSELHAVDLASGSHRQLTYARNHVSQPAWSPDGNTLAFVAPAATRQWAGLSSTNEDTAGQHYFIIIQETAAGRSHAGKRVQQRDHHRHIRTADRHYE